VNFRFYSSHGCQSFGGFEWQEFLIRISTHGRFTYFHQTRHFYIEPDSLMAAALRVTFHADPQSTQDDLKLRHSLIVRITWCHHVPGTDNTKSPARSSGLRSRLGSTGCWIDLTSDQLSVCDPASLPPRLYSTISICHGTYSSTQHFRPRLCMDGNIVLWWSLRLYT